MNKNAGVEAFKKLSTVLLSISISCFCLINHLYVKRKGDLIFNDSYEYEYVKRLFL